MKKHRESCIASKTRLCIRWVFLLMSSAGVAAGDTHYVSPAGLHQAPYTNWVSAATNIQDAIDAAVDGDAVLVGNGVYDTGGIVVHETLTSRIAITKAVTVSSIDGPDGAIILGEPAVRCAYVGEGARLEGFTLTNGHANVGGFTLTELSGGGVWCEVTAVVSNCVVTGNNALWHGGGAYGGIIQDSMVTGNHTSLGGGGAYKATVENSVVSGNTAGDTGGGTYVCTVDDCIISDNAVIQVTSSRAPRGGGGTVGGTVLNSTITGNRAVGFGGGGSFDSALTNCIVSGNTTDGSGGGMWGGWAFNCAIFGNEAGGSGGGTWQTLVFSSTVAGNTASAGGGVAHLMPGSFASVGNIVYYNSAPIHPNYLNTTFEYTCTTPDPGGTGNITNAPGLVALDNPHIVWTSPCRDAGTNWDWMVTAEDIDGEPRIGNVTVDMGCDELHAASFIGSLSVGIQADYTNVMVGFPIQFEALIGGQPAGYQWSWDNGDTTLNIPFLDYTFDLPGNYEVVLLAWNLDGPTAATVTVHVVNASTNYVSHFGSHTSPYTTWSTAATNIQDAIDVAPAGGGVVLVANGVYDRGGTVVHNGLTNRVAITRQGVVVKSAVGPENTVIMGAGPMGDAAVRCVYLGEDARLEGFTLTGGHTRTEGNLFTERSGGAAYSEPSAVVTNCILSGNRAESGGGSYGGTLKDCMITGNSADYYGGGAYQSTLMDCTITDNSAAYRGGGTYDGTVVNCILSGNATEDDGGGSFGGTITNTAIFSNFAAGNGGGTIYATVENCTITGNMAGNGGGGTYSGTVQNSLVYYNDAPINPNYSGGTVEYTCTTPDPGGAGNITNAPGLAGLSNPHVVTNSPCLDAGTNLEWMLTAFDIDGEPRIGNGAVDMGCDEVYAGGLTGSLVVAIYAERPLALAGHPISFEADIQGRPTGYRWLWGDGAGSPGTLRANHIYVTPGDYDVVLEAWNVDGASAATVTVHVLTGYTNYVSHAGSHTSPYDSWPTAATNIQAAITAQLEGGVVLVTNGVYGTGGVVMHGSMTNRVVVTNEVTVSSVNGPENTLIVGSGPLGNTAVRCAYVGFGARLQGFTLTNGHTRTFGDAATERSGGGVWCEPTAVVSNCIVSGSAADVWGGGSYQGMIQGSVIRGNSANYGGGAYGGDVEGCVVSGNTAITLGGGVYECSVLNSMIIGNTSTFYYAEGGGAYGGTVRNSAIIGNTVLGEQASGGGVARGTVENSTVIWNTAPLIGGGTYLSEVVNSIVYYNIAPGSPNCYIAFIGPGSMDYTCTIPIPPWAGPGNVTNAPLFVDVNSSNLHLSAASPCIDAGMNEAWMVGATDLDGKTRIQQGVVDMGCYEYGAELTDFDGDDIEDAWELRYFLSLTNVSYESDWDGEGFSDGHEFHAGTIPTNASSYLGIESIAIDTARSELVIEWQSVSGKQYTVYGSSNLIYGVGAALEQHIPADPPLNTYSGTVNGVPWRTYGVAVEP